MNFSSNVAVGQRQAAVWSIGSGYQFDFQSGSFEFKAFTANNKVNATICDENGNLLLYTDGLTVWNGNNEELINGTDLIEKDLIITPGCQPVFIPYPKNNGYYFLIYETVPRGGYKIEEKKLLYAVININAQSDRGEVISKNIMIHDNYHQEGPTIAGFCDNSYYWLAVDRNENVIDPINRDRIYFYKIDENGVNPNPVINDELAIGNSGGYKFSPNGDKIYFRCVADYQEHDEIVNFNFTTGELYNFRSIKHSIEFPREFSPDSRLFYTFSGGDLIQIDVSFSDETSIWNYYKILSLSSNSDIPYPGQDMQLAPDGKIYFLYDDVNDGKTKLGRINQPNKKGDACDAELEFLTIDFNIFRFPSFVTSFFRDKHPEMMDEVFSNAGDDVELCANSTAMIGTPEDAVAFFNWFPETGLSDPLAAQTIFKPIKNLKSPQTTSFTLRVTDGNCWVNFDAMNVTILPFPNKLPIDGSWSVCPYVEGVDYWTEEDANDLNWLVEGGEIITNSSKDSIKINWWDTNFNASTSVFSTNDYQCNSDTSVFPVRINVELLTETPKGLNQICIAEKNDVTYSIRYTNGSEYNWTVDGGNIINGQGTNQINVDWLDEGIFSLWVEETSLTIDTICYGESEPLEVEIVNDSLEISLSQISFNPDNYIKMFYYSERLNNESHQLYAFTENNFDDIENEISVREKFDGSYEYSVNINGVDPWVVRLKVINSCDEDFYSNPQEPVILQGTELKDQNSILLEWNINRFWQNDGLEHEIWCSPNDKNSWRLIAGNELNTQFNFSLQELALIYFFRVKEINLEKNIESWSNTIKIEVEDDLVIPDVFTPNGDGINDVWQIRNITFHPFESVVIYDRYGQVVYECNNEFIPWNGKLNGKIIQGTYFYKIVFDPQNIKYGQVTILQ